MGGELRHRLERSVRMHVHPHFALDDGHYFEIASDHERRPFGG